MTEAVELLWLLTGMVLLLQAIFSPRQFAMLFSPTSAPGKALLCVVLAIQVGAAMGGLWKVAVVDTPVPVLGSVSLAAFIWMRFVYLHCARRGASASRAV